MLHGDATVAGAVIVNAGRVLLIRRTVAAGSLVWSFPSGMVEAGEEPAEARPARPWRSGRRRGGAVGIG